MIYMRFIATLFLCISLTSLTACSLLPTDFEQVESKAYINTKQTWLGETASQLQAENTAYSTMYLISRGY